MSVYEFMEQRTPSNIAQGLRGNSPQALEWLEEKISQAEFNLKESSNFDVESKYMQFCKEALINVQLLQRKAKDDAELYSPLAHAALHLADSALQLAKNFKVKEAA